MTTIRSDYEVESRGGAGPDGRRRSEVSAALIRKVDLCRGLFAFLVVAAHAYDACWVIRPDSLRSLPEWARLVLSCTVQCGDYWVMGFFVISGYCIQLSVGRQVETGRFSPGVYLAARLTRIMPLYYLGLLFALAVEALIAPIRVGFYPDGLNAVGWVAQLVFAQRFFETFGSFAPSWTITYELFYYLFFGVLAIVASRHGGRPSWYGMAVCVALGGALQVLYLAGEKNAVTLHTGLIFGLGTIWFLGALVAEHGPDLVLHRPARVVARAWPLVFAAAVVLRGDGRCPVQVIYLVLGAAFTLMILRFQAQDTTRPAGPDRAPAWLSTTARVVGLASYPTYLFHGPVLLTLCSTISRWEWPGDWRADWLAMVGSGIGLGVALGWLLERPIMAWRAGLLAKLKTASAGRLATIPANRLDNPIATGARST